MAQNQLEIINKLGAALDEYGPAMDKLMPVAENAKRLNHLNQIKIEPFFGPHREETQADHDLEDLAEYLVRIRDEYGSKSCNSTKLRQIIDRLVYEIGKRPEMTASLSAEDREVFDRFLDAYRRLKEVESAFKEFLSEDRRRSEEEAREKAERERLFKVFLAEREEQRKREEEEAERRREEETREAFEAWLANRENAD